MRVLVLAAHPDDEVLGCGGTVARLAAEGHTVNTVIFCENSTVRYGDGMARKIEDMALNCARVLGVEEPVLLGMPDQKLDTYSALEMAQVVEGVINDFQPEMVFTHHGGDINEDHQVLFEATMVATRPLPNRTVRTVLTYETISSTEWGVSNYHSSFKPNVFYNISDTLGRKLEAFGVYTSEVRPFPHPRSLEAIEVRAKDWGSRVGLPAAEPFQLIRTLN